MSSYGIDNPLFLDLKSNPRYLVRTILPWMVKYLWTMPKIDRLSQPVTEYLKKISNNHPDRHDRPAFFPGHANVLRAQLF
jgi:hypothetical protein